MWLRRTTLPGGLRICSPTAECGGWEHTTSPYRFPMHIRVWRSCLERISSAAVQHSPDLRCSPCCSPSLLGRARHRQFPSAYAISRTAFVSGCVWPCQGTRAAFVDKHHLPKCIWESQIPCACDLSPVGVQLPVPDLPSPGTELWLKVSRVILGFAVSAKGFRN